MILSTAYSYCPSHITVTPLCPLELFKETSGLHDVIICCRGWYHDVDNSWSQCSKWWYAVDFIASPLSQTLISTTGWISEHYSVTGYYHHDVDDCLGFTTEAHEHLWVPCFVFDTILALLSLLAATWNSKHYFRLPRLNRPRLVYIIIQGNVIYFLGCALSFPHRIGFDNGM